VLSRNAARPPALYVMGGRLQRGRKRVTIQRIQLLLGPRCCR
jgi:hypothetical protein